MSKLMIGFVAALSLASFGCKKKGGGAAAEALAKMEGFSKSMCECKDKACADKVNEEMTKWGTEMAKNAKPGDAEKPDPDLAKKSADVMTKYTECMTKLMMAGAGGGSDAAKPEPAAGSGSDAAKPEPAAGSGSDAKKDEPAAGSDAKKEEPAMKKEEPAMKKEEKKPDDKKAGGW